MQGLVLLHEGTTGGQVVACVNADGSLTSSALGLLKLATEPVSPERISRGVGDTPVQGPSQFEGNAGGRSGGRKTGWLSDD